MAETIEKKSAEFQRILHNTFRPVDAALVKWIADLSECGIDAKVTFNEAAGVLIVRLWWR